MKNVCVPDRYIEIDGLASMTAYAELLNKIGKPAVAMSRALFNASVPNEMRQWSFDVRTTKPQADDAFILVDFSNPDWLTYWMDENRVEEVIDHRPGHENYWRAKIEDKAQIEPIGAAATLILEKWRDAGQLENMSETSARLIACAILDQTLDFQADITTERDHTAYDDCLTRANFGGDLREWYFKACQAEIERDLEKSIKDDTKFDWKVPSFDAPMDMAQLAVWEGKDFLTKYGREIVKILGDKSWLLNLIDISAGKSQFLTNDWAIAKVITELTGAQFDDNGLLAIADRPWLRKEILRKGMEHAKS